MYTSSTPDVVRQSNSSLQCEKLTEMATEMTIKAM
jgi:hypothetical protein